MANKKRKTNPSKVRLLAGIPIVIVSIIVFIYTLGTNLYILYEVEEEKKAKENEYVELQEKTDELKTEIIKLQDPEYLAKYARENYSYSKKDEIIIKIDDSNSNTKKVTKKEEKKDNVEKVEKVEISDSAKFQSEWIIFGCVVGVILILAYAFIKSNYSKKVEDEE